MMKNPICPIIISIGPSNNANHWKILTISPSNCIQNAKTTHSESHNTCTDAATPGIAVGRVAGIELIAAANICEARLRNEVIKKGEIEVARDTEYVTHADLDEAAGKKAAEGGVTGGGGWVGVGILN